MAIPIIPPPSRWNAKHWILVALIGTLVAIAIVAVISISLSPAPIHFSILNATIDHKDLDQYYNFTLLANNTSWRTEVRYVALSAEIWFSSTGWVPAEVNPGALPSKWQRPRNATNIAFSAEYGQYDVANTTKNTTINASDQVVVTAMVWFKFGLAQTRPYNVRASCNNVHFESSNFVHAISPINCTAG